MVHVCRLEKEVSMHGSTVGVGAVRAGWRRTR